MSCDDSTSSSRAEELGEGTGKRQKSLHALPSNTVRLIGSSQVITSVSNVVKELIENSLDANGSNIEIKLENSGLDRIEVRDNGNGIPQCEADRVAKRYHTSKISSFEDLELLETYGFRGEALGSLCTVSDLSVTTKTQSDDVGMTYSFSHQGEITSQKPSHFGQGTTVVAVNLFKNLPVRKQFYNTSKKKKDELKKVEDLVMSYGVIRPDIRISLRHNKDLVWQKFSVMDHRTVLLNILGTSVFNQLEKKLVTHDNPKVELEAFIPKVKSNIQLTSRSSPDRNLVFVNKRPVILKDVDKTIRHYYMSHQQCDTTRYPIYFLSVTLPSCDVDVNVEPDKTKVMLQHQAFLMRLVTDLLESHYGALVPVTRVKNIENNNDRINPTDCDSGLSGQRSHEVEGGSKIEEIRKHEGKISTENTRTESKDFSLKSPETVCSEEMDGFDLDEEIKIYDSKNVPQYDNLVTDLSQDDPFGSFDLEVHTPVKQIFRQESAEGAKVEQSILQLRTEQVISLASEKSSEQISISDVNNAVKETHTLLHSKGYHSDKGDNFTSANQLDSPSDNVDRMSQKEIAYQELMDDIRMDDILCTFSDAEPNKTDNKISPADGSSCKISDTQSSVVLSNTNTAMVKSDDQWSRGQLLTDGVGKAIQGPVMLLPPPVQATAPEKVDTVNANGKRPSSESPSHGGTGEPKAKRVSLGQMTLFDLMNSQPVKRLQTAFIHFSKEVRPKVVEENPEAGFQQIAKVTGEKWKMLTDAEKQKYEQLCTRDVERYREQMKAAREGVNKLDKCKQLPDKMSRKSGHMSIKDCLVNTMSPKTPQTPNIPRTHRTKLSPRGQQHSVKTVTMPFSFDELKRKLSGGLRQSQSPADAPLLLIGYLKSHGCWLGCHGDRIEILNPYGIEETVLYQRLMEDHILTTQTLDVPQNLNPGCVNRNGSLYDLWATLLSLTQSSELIGGYQHIQDKRLTANGFDVRWFHEDGSIEPTLQLVGLAQHFLRYGVSELREVLELISVTGAQTVSRCRPMKVLEYLKGEAVRIVRKSPDKTCKEDMEDLLDQMTNQLPHGCLMCLHNKPFRQEIYNLGDLPFSQTQTQCSNVAQS